MDNAHIAHGGPIHIGDPSVLGITNLARPDWGDAVTVEDDEVPVFWACGVTSQAVIMAVKPEIAITHSPGHMFITDLQDSAIYQDEAASDARQQAKHPDGVAHGLQPHARVQYPK